MARVTDTPIHKFMKQWQRTLTPMIKLMEDQVPNNNPFRNRTLLIRYFRFVMRNQNLRNLLNACRVAAEQRGENDMTQADIEQVAEFYNAVNAQLPVGHELHMFRSPPADQPEPFRIAGDTATNLAPVINALGGGGDGGYTAEMVTICLATVRGNFDNAADRRAYGTQLVMNEFFHGDDVGKIYDGGQWRGYTTDNGRRFGVDMIREKWGKIVKSVAGLTITDGVMLDQGQMVALFSLPMPDDANFDARDAGLAGAMMGERNTWYEMAILEGCNAIDDTADWFSANIPAEARALTVLDELIELCRFSFGYNQSDATIKVGKRMRPTTNQRFNALFLNNRDANHYNCHSMRMTAVKLKRALAGMGERIPVMEVFHCYGAMGENRQKLRALYYMGEFIARMQVALPNNEYMDALINTTATAFDKIVQQRTNVLQNPVTGVRAQVVIGADEPFLNWNE